MRCASRCTCHPSCNRRHHHQCEAADCHRASSIRGDANATILALHQEGVPIKEIARRLGHSRGLVRKVVRGLRTDVFRIRESTRDSWLPDLGAEWTGGCRNGAELWRRLRARGFAGSLWVATEWTIRRRRAEQATDQKLQMMPSARTIARMMTIGRDHLTRADTVTIAAIENGVPALDPARDLIQRFHVMIRTKAIDEFSPWIDVAGDRLVAPFARGIAKDRGCLRGNHAAVVKRSGRRTGQQTQAGQASDVCQSQDRLARSATCRCSVAFIVQSRTNKRSRETICSRLIGVVSMEVSKLQKRISNSTRVFS